MMSTINWDHLRIFRTLADAGSLLSASEDLGISPPTISRQMARLEQTVNARLFDRSPKGYSLTNEGEGLRELVEKLDEPIQAIERFTRTLDVQAAGTVRLATGFWFSRFIMERLPSFYAEHPDIDISFITSHALSDLSRGDADISIRNTRPTSGDLVLRKLLDASFAVYGTADYTAHNPDAYSEQRFVKCDWIGGAEALENLASFRWLHARLEIPPVLKCSQTFQLLDAVKSGVGLAVLPMFVGDAEENLICVSEPIYLEQSEIWLVVHEDMRRAPAVRAVIDWLVPLMRSI
ncbi:LysR family transcriptional regulator [Kordiimonas aquimaris]|uniref:LysR family transcriptional regulator n=1 Tax=Kordiimonas aquimaris TaxID=707591 RepID=UPI0021CF08DC|nr:LysR family transcriptional regulator [Kordiimonas aquimaris]